MAAYKKLLDAGCSYQDAVAMLNYLLDKKLWADGVMVKGQWCLAGFGAAEELAVRVTPAEAGERHVFPDSPVGQVTEMDLIVLTGFLRAGGLDVKTSLAKRLFSSKGRGGR